MSNKIKRKYRIGDRLIVTGDVADIDHDFPTGTLVTVDEFNDAWPTWCHCHNEQGETWWVDEMDLKRIPPDPAEPTEDEILQLFGLKPKAHCTTCTCTED